MSSFRKQIILVLILFLQLGLCSEAKTDEWEEIKGDHFVVKYDPKIRVSDARNVLHKSEKYYKRIGAHIGYSRYSKFWTWEDRVQIFLYPDRQTYIEKTGQPTWSTGFAANPQHRLTNRAIVTFMQEESLYKELLPHEISHLVLKDFLSEDINIPLWFDEGVAQLQEEEKRKQSGLLLRALASQDRTIPLRQLFSVDIRTEKDHQRVWIYYAHCISLIDFMITKYGSLSFGALCRKMRDGESFEGSLKGAYANRVQTLDDLEQRWLKYLKKQGMPKI